MQTPLRALFDFSKTHFGTDEETIALAVNFCAERSIEKENVSIICLRRHLEMLKDGFLGAAVQLVRHHAEGPLAAKSLLQNLGPTQKMFVVSYNGAVLDQVDATNPLFEAMSFSSLKRGPGSRPSRFAEHEAVKRFGELFRLTDRLPEEVGVTPAPARSTVAADPDAEPRPQSSGDAGAEATPSGSDRQHQEHRSRKMGEIVKKARFGPFPLIRPQLWDEIDAVVRDERGLPLSTALDRAIDRLKSALTSALEVGERDPERDRRTWIAVRRFAEQALVRAGVAMGPEETPIASDWRTSNVPVSSMAENWRVRTDAEIVLVIVRGLDDVSPRDDKNLARALFFSSTDACTTHVRQCVAYLLESGKAVEIFEEGECYLRPAEDADGPQLKVVRG